MLVPNDFTPKNLEKEKYTARKLCARDVYLDFIAVMSSIDIIHQTRGGKWPTSDLTIEEDLIDLGWHQREFEFKTSFAFTLMNKDESECLGCIYFYPPRASMSSAKSKEGYDANVSWWITQKFYDQGMYDEVCWDIRSWIEKDWPFKKVFFSNKQLPEGFTRELIKSLPNEKCVVIMKGQTRCLVIDQGTDHQTTYRLPLLSEISASVINRFPLTPIHDQVSLLVTPEEISPWDLFDPFPPPNYSDFGYLELSTKTDNQYWKLLNTEDKELVSSVQKSVLEEIEEL